MELEASLFPVTAEDMGSISKETLSKLLKRREIPGSTNDNPAYMEDHTGRPCFLLHSELYFTIVLSLTV